MYLQWNELSLSLILICNLFAYLLLHVPPPTHIALFKNNFIFTFCSSFARLTSVCPCLSCNGKPSTGAAFQINLISQSRWNHVPQHAGNTACKRPRRPLNPFVARALFWLMFTLLHFQKITWFSYSKADFYPACTVV